VAKRKSKKKIKKADLLPKPSERLFVASLDPEEQAMRRDRDFDRARNFGRRGRRGGLTYND